MGETIKCVIIPDTNPDDPKCVPAVALPAPRGRKGNPMTRTFAYTPYSGVYSPDNPRGIAKHAARTMDTCIDDIRSGRVDRVVIQRAFGMFEKDLTKSWELEDHRHHRYVQDLLPKYRQIADDCERLNVTLAYCSGLNVDSVPLNMSIPAHRAALVRTCKWLRDWGARELWIDTGGSISNRIYSGDDSRGMGVLDAAELADDHGITLVVEYTKHIDTRVPTYERIRRRATDPATVYGATLPGVPSFVCYGFNGGGCEPAEEVRAYADKGHTMVAWNEAARKQATQQATETEVKG